MFLLGFLVGLTVTASYCAWLQASKKSPVIVDPWWLENADRWEWLREYELRQRANA